MAGSAAVLSCMPSSLALTGDGGLRERIGARAADYGMDSLQPSPLLSQSSCCTSSYIRIRGRQRAVQLTISTQHVLNGARSSSTRARLAVVCTRMSERIASSQFCSCSSSPNREIERYTSFMDTSKVRARRRVDGDGFKRMFLSGSPIASWNRRREQNVSEAGRGQTPPSENLDLGDFKFEINSDLDSGGGEASAIEGDDLDVTEIPSSVENSNGVAHAESQAVTPNLRSSSWRDFISKRWTIVILCFFAFLLCNMDRVNMSIAILPMASEYHWTPTTVGVVQSSFFWGYLLTQVAGGIWADSIGGKQVLGFGVIWWSLATIATPIAAKIGLPALLLVRACMGVGEGVAMPAMNNLLSRWIPVEERSRSLAFVYSGMYLGSVTGLACSPGLIQRFGWPSVFFSFGSVGAIWFALWQQYASSSPEEDPTISDAERKLILKGNKSREAITRIPWGLILSKAPVWALIVCHFCHNWGTFILLTWMPTYYNQVLGFNLMESGLFSVLPWLTMALSANVGGWIADSLVSKGYSVTVVRKIMQTIGFLGPAFFLTQLSHITSPHMAVLCMMASQGSDAFSQAGLYSNHQDIGPRYSGILLGLSNTAGVLAGVFGTAATGYILQHGSWDDVFKVAVGLYLFGTVVWNVFSTGEQLFD